MTAAVARQALQRQYRFWRQAGDAVLREFAQRLKSSLRPSDQPYRLAGDEFVIILERIDSADSVGRLANRLLEAVRQPFRFGGADLTVTTASAW